jgi:hypothetical protein
MAAFTTSLLVGLALGAAGGGTAAAIKAKGAKGPATPGPSGADNSLAAPPVAPDTQAAAGSKGVIGAAQAMTKAKRKARPGIVRDSVSTLAPPKPVVRPQTLVGGIGGAY